MSVWRQFRRGLRALVHRSESDRDVADEVASYLDQARAEHEARGLSPAAARRAAHIELGGVTSVTEQVRGYGWENVVEGALADLSYAARRLRGTPGFTLIATGTLALGIGATTAIFSTVKPILFDSLPYPDAGRVVAVWERGVDGSRVGATFGMYRELAAGARTFAELSLFKPWQATATGGERPERLAAQRVSANYFRMLGVTPALGRDFEAADDRLNAPNVILISESIWRHRFAARAEVLGQSITLDDRPYVIVGVLPRDFENILAPSAELWAPLQYDLSEGRAWGHHLEMAGRLAAGVDQAAAVRDLDVVGARVLAEQRPDTYGAEVAFGVAALQADITSGVRPALLAVLGAVLLVLAIACVNVVNLLLARAAQRRGEFALRAALGAGRMRLVRQLMTESMLLAAISGAAGLTIALIGLEALRVLSPPELPRIQAIRLDSAVFAFGLGVTTLIGLILGLLPALRSASTTGPGQLQAGARRVTSMHRRVRRSLVCAEVALALMLLVGAGLLLRSLQSLLAVPPGFTAERVLTMQVHTSGTRFQNDTVTRAFFDQVLGAVRQVPGVEAAALTSQLPLTGDYDSYGVHFEYSPIERADQLGGAFRYAVTPDYIETMGIELRRGRLLTERDRAGAPHVVLINESLAKRALPGLDPIGQRLRIGAMDGPPYTIVGVVGDVRQQSLSLSPPDGVYITPSQSLFADRVMTVVVRARSEPLELAAALRQAVWSVDRDQPIVRVATMDKLVADTAAQRRFTLLLFEAFAIIALILAAAGIYGVLSGSVAERTREIGVRAALGATRGDILMQLLGEGLRLTGVGMAIGLAGALAASQALATLLFGVSQLDPATYLAVLALLGSTALLACIIPAARAARLDPVITLRAD